MTISTNLLFSPVRFNELSRLLMVLRVCGLAIGIALLAALGIQHDVAMHAGYRAVPQLPAPELQIPLSPSIIDIATTIPLEQRSYTVYGIVTAPNDPTYLVDVAQRTVTLSELADFRMATDMFVLQIRWKPESDSLFLGNEMELSCRYPLGDGEFQELPSTVRHGFFKAIGVTVVPVSISAQWDDPNRWLGWGASQVGRVDPYQFYVAVAVSEPNASMVGGGIEELCAIDFSAITSLKGNIEEGDPAAPFSLDTDSIRENLSRREKSSSAAQLASRHFGMPLLLALMAAGLIAASVSRLAWIGISFALTSVFALTFLAVLDLRAMHHACGILEDREQPAEVRLQAAAKATGSFFWRKSVERSMKGVIVDQSDAQVADGVGQLLRAVITD
ncbi:MAG: hypothetical protein KDN22_09210 [Verrucomicrobiae bacterium]|nr:hypothetical protein [Verrucomicrobiae bacterium]